MNTPTKRIFYLFGPKFVKNEPQTKVWGSLTCKSQFPRPADAAARPFAAAFALVAAVRAVRAGRSRSPKHSRTRSQLRVRRRAGGPPCYLTPAFFLARSIAAICSSESLMEP